jgi:hypothetical protein
MSATGPELHLDVSALQRNVLLLEVSTLQGPELHLDVSAPHSSVLLLEVSTLQRPELHLDVSALQRSVLLLEVSATGPELHLDVSAVCTTEECAASGGVYCTLQGSKLHLDVSALKGCVLLLEVSATGPELHLDLTYVINRFL